MTFPLAERFAKFNMIKFFAFEVGLSTKISFPQISLLKGLERIRTDFPILTEEKFNEEDKKFILRSTDVEVEKQFYFKVTDSKTIQYICGSSVDFDYKSRVESIFTTVQDGFELNPFNVDFLDIKLYFQSEWEGHHYKVIMDSFFNGSPLSFLFEPRYLLGNDINIRGMIDDSRICVFIIESNITDNEIITNKFKNDRLRLSLGIAQTKNIPIDKKIADIFLEHSEATLNFIRDRVIPNILEPLDKTIISYKEKHDNGV